MSIKQAINVYKAARHADASVLGAVQAAERAGFKIAPASGEEVTAIERAALQALIDAHPNNLLESNMRECILQEVRERGDHEIIVGLAP